MRRAARAARAAFRQRLVLRFLLVGAGNTALSFALYAALVLAGLHYAAANLVALIAGIAVSYLTNGAVVFRGLGRASFLRYVACWAAIYLVQVAVIAATAAALGPRLPGGVAPEIAGGVAALAVAVPLSFVLQRRFVFRWDPAMGRGQGG